MTTKEYLQQIGKLNKMINNKMVELAQMKEMAYSIKTMNTDEHVMSSSDPDRIGCAYVKIEEMEQKIDKMIDDYVDKKEKIIKQIESIEDENLYDVLFLKYIAKKRFEDIAVEIEKSWRQTIRLHGAALKRFEEKYGNEYLSCH